MLARLAQQTGLPIGVDREGQILRVAGSLTGSSESDVTTIITIIEEMGYSVEPAAVPEEVERWYAHDEVDELSVEEARVLAQRWAAELERDAVIPDPERIVQPLRTALEGSFRSASLTGEVGALEVPKDAFSDVLSDPESSRLLEWIASRVGTGPQHLA